jgi:hypothetical protein
MTMENEPNYSIPAANIGNIDLIALARVNPEGAKEITRLRDLMDRGGETKEDFLRLCRMLFDVGSITASEYLLRRNLDFYDGQRLYVQLFGTTKQDEFDAAIEAFKVQFDLDVTPLAQKAFLIATFHCLEGPPRSDAFTLLSRSCDIKFGYIDQNKIEVDIWLHDPDRDALQADECLRMFYVNGIWEIADPMEN